MKKKKGLLDEEDLDVIVGDQEDEETVRLMRERAEQRAREKAERDMIRRLKREAGEKVEEEPEEEEDVAEAHEEEVDYDGEDIDYQRAVSGFHFSLSLSREICRFSFVFPLHSICPC